MSRLQPSLFEEARMSLSEALELTGESLRTYGRNHRVWVLAWSGGKDSTATLIATLYLISSGAVEAPERLIVLYADTRAELPPLAIAAEAIMAQLRERGIDVRTVLAPLDKRMLVYMLGRGVPPPNNMTFRWCTRQIKVDPMQREIERVAVECGFGELVPEVRVVRGVPTEFTRYRGFGTDKALVLTGVRLGESAARDQRIAISCSRDGGECGQGWYQETLPEALCDTLAPILHWRLCFVLDFLMFFAPSAEYGGWDTSLVAMAYGGEDAEEIAARMGCNGCPLVDDDVALDALLRLFWDDWAHLVHLKRLRPVFRALRLPRNRLRQPGGEARKDGSLSPNQHRMGPLTMTARAWALGEILSIQADINTEAAARGRPGVDLIDEEEEQRIRGLWSMNTWPHGWTGKEPRADAFFAEADSLFARRVECPDCGEDLDVPVVNGEHAAVSTCPECGCEMDAAVGSTPESACTT